LASVEKKSTCSENLAWVSCLSSFITSKTFLG
jgi:hypothetical protein